jgi:hypothetical protein
LERDDGLQANVQATWKSVLTELDQLKSVAPVLTVEGSLAP